MVGLTHPPAETANDWAGTRHGGRKSDPRCRRAERFHLLNTLSAPCVTEEAVCVRGIIMSRGSMAEGWRSGVSYPPKRGYPLRPFFVDKIGQQLLK